MNPKGFCKSHGCISSHSNKSSSSKTNQNNFPPDELTKTADILFSNLIYRLLQSFRHAYVQCEYKFNSAFLTHRTNLQDVLNEIQPYLDMLNELCTLGTPIRKILVDYMISESFYKLKCKYESMQKESFKRLYEPIKEMALVIEQCDEEIDDNENDLNLKYEHKIYLKSLKRLPIINAPPLFKSNANLLFKLEHKHMIDELLYWCIQFEFPENVVKFLLSLLPDLRYKNVFIKSFVAQYSYISWLLLNSKSEHLSSRVVHISVQLFSNEAIAIKALDECHLLPIILSTLYNMIAISKNENGDENSLNKKLLIKNRIESIKTTTTLTTGALVVDPDHTILQENLYWLVISDLVNLLSHKQVALTFLSDKNLFGLWLELIGYFQGMNLNVRQFGEHLQHEQPTYFSSFSAELEFCSSIMWSFIQHLNRENDQIYLTNQLLCLILSKLDEWLALIGFDNETTVGDIKRPCFKHLSFHLPLHRYYSTFLYNALYVQMASTIDLELFSTTKYSNKSALLVNLLAHPLQLQIGISLNKYSYLRMHILKFN
jgi:E3 ubiquitin-protein ligase UBR3